ncbi:dTMP kinase [Micromonospora parva]|uniref:dTMP kinase n=1 Tax=Micromonospora parva TaxID=1464048 RepID=UPI0033C24DA3
MRKYVLAAPFIVFEGIDGSGKSTQAAMLADRLRSLNVPVHLTSEPTGGPIGTLIRQGMSGRIELDDRAIAALFVADRLDHLVNPVDGVLDMLRADVVVVSDRYYFSSYAYHASSMSVEWVVEANAVASSTRRADLTVFLDVTPELALDRLGRGRSTKQRYETAEHLVEVRAAYKSAFERYGKDETIVCLDGGQDVDTLGKLIWESVAPLIEKM